ncbi:MAG TPA: hypothetical protein VLN73_09770, partial [Alphaproteobacteria bacterium]|nr:hypothetical protein [Alphaproteobacteria bacterium]
MWSKISRNDGPSRGPDEAVCGRSNPLSRTIDAARGFSRRFARDESGAVIILVGLVIIVLSLFAGLAFDAARGYLP